MAAVTLSAAELAVYAARKERSRAHRAWMRRVQRRLPELARRVFALRGRQYPGCGMHYQLETDLAKVIRIAHTSPYEDPEVERRQAVAAAVIDQVIVEGLHATLATAERGAAALAQATLASGAQGL